MSLRINAKNNKLEYVGINIVGAYRYKIKIEKQEYLFDIDPDLVDDIYPRAIADVKERESDLVNKNERKKIRARWFLSLQKPRMLTTEDAIKPIATNAMKDAIDNISPPVDDKSSMENTPNN